GCLIYRDGFPGCDVIYRTTDFKTEEFIVIRQPEQSDAEIMTFNWLLELGAGAGRLTPRLTPMHTIELCDLMGVPRLRIDLPEGKDADGRLLRAGRELAY